jgi:hypothetical protein
VRTTTAAAAGERERHCDAADQRTLDVHVSLSRFPIRILGE